MTWEDSGSASTSTPTPAFPYSTTSSHRRSNSQRHPQARPLPSLPEPWDLSPDTIDLIPAPLFSNRNKTPPPDRLEDLPVRAQTPTRRPNTPLLRRNSTFSSITSSISRGLRSASPALSSTSSCSELGSSSRPGSRASTPGPHHGLSRSLSHITTSSSSLYAPSRSPTPSHWSTPSEAQSSLHHRPSLRRKSTPKTESLRTLSKKDSETSLRRLYSQQTLEYLDGSIQRSVRSSQECLSIRIVEDDEE